MHKYYGMLGEGPGQCWGETSVLHFHGNQSLKVAMYQYSEALKAPSHTRHLAKRNLYKKKNLSISGNRKRIALPVEEFCRTLPLENLAACMSTMHSPVEQEQLALNLSGF